MSISVLILDDFGQSLSLLFVAEWGQTTMPNILHALIRWTCGNTILSRHQTYNGD